MFRLVPVALFVLVACSDGPGPSIDAGGDGSADAATDAHDAAPVDASDANVDDASDAAPACTCAGVSTCCDGCHPRNGGMQCDDGLACKTSSTCQATGVCGAGATVTCSTPAEPQCQAATCTEPGGCATASINEGWECNDGNAATYADLCTGGACVGTPCECSSGPCCDGCHIRDTSHKCLEDGPVAAECYGAVTQVTVSCSGHTNIRFTVGDRFCDGTSTACTGAAVPTATTIQGTCAVIDPDGMPGSAVNPLICQPDGSDILGARCRRWCPPP